MYSGSPLNRLSWLRNSHTFLNAIAVDPKTRWLLFKSGNPLVIRPPPSSESTQKKSLTFAYLPTVDVLSFLGPTPFFGQGKDPEVESDLGKGLISKEEKGTFTESVRHRGEKVVFLGLHESASGPTSLNTSANKRETGALPSSDFADPDKAAENVQGTPYFAMDVADLELEDAEVNRIVEATETAKSQGANFVSKEEAKDGRTTPTLQWLDARSVMTSVDLFHGAVFAEARSMVDWNSRNKFCAGCGEPQVSLWGGWKFGCSSLLPWANNEGKKPCPSGKGLHNYTHPRSDPVVIMCAIDQSGDKILLGQNNRFTLPFYSALAGFIEPGETFEDAVKREMWEEAGVRVWDVQYHGGQPWPFPASLMCGFYARADSREPVRTDLDNELKDARWFTRAEINTVLSHATGSYLDLARLSSAAPKDGEKDPNEPPFRVPPTTAIAGVLIKDWAEGKVKLPVLNLGEGAGMKGNL